MVNFIFCDIYYCRHTWFHRDRGLGPRDCPGFVCTFLDTCGDILILGFFRRRIAKKVTKEGHENISLCGWEYICHCCSCSFSENYKSLAIDGRPMGYSY